MNNREYIKGSHRPKEADRVVTNETRQKAVEASKTKTGTRQTATPR